MVISTIHQIAKSLHPKTNELFSVVLILPLVNLRKVVKQTQRNITGISYTASVMKYMKMTLSTPNLR